MPLVLAAPLKVTRAERGELERMARARCRTARYIQREGCCWRPMVLRTIRSRGSATRPPTRCAVGARSSRWGRVDPVGHVAHGPREWVDGMVDPHARRVLLGR